MSKIVTSNFFCIWVSVCLRRKPVAVIEICDQGVLLSTGLGANFRMFRTPSAQVVRPLHHRTGEKLARIFFILFPAHVVCRPCGLRAGATSPPRPARAHLTHPLSFLGWPAGKTRRTEIARSLSRPLVCRPHPLSLPPSAHPLPLLSHYLRRRSGDVHPAAAAAAKGEQQRAERKGKGEREGGMLICSTVDEHRMHASLNLEFDAKGAEKRGRWRGAATVTQEIGCQPYAIRLLVFLHMYFRFQWDTKLLKKQ